jgi:hypothetical protein
MPSTTHATRPDTSRTVQDCRLARLGSNPTHLARMPVRRRCVRPALALFESRSWNRSAPSRSAISRTRPPPIAAICPSSVRVSSAGRADRSISDISVASLPVNLHSSLGS